MQHFKRKKMKTYIKTILIVLIGGTLLLSCEGNLNQVNPNQATENSFWRNEADFNLALTSCYTPLKNALNGGYYGTRGVMLRICRSDEVAFRNDITDIYTASRFTNSNTNRLTQGMFYQFYNALYRTNLIMQKLEEKSLKMYRYDLKHHNHPPLFLWLNQLKLKCGGKPQKI